MPRVPGPQLRQRILDEAVEMVRTLGVAQLTMRALAERLGYSPATIYLHYRNKEELLRQVGQLGYRELIALAEPELSHPDPVDALEAGGRCYVDFALANPELYRLMFEDVDLGQFSSEDLATRYKLWTLYREPFERGVGAGLFRDQDADSMTLVAWSMLHGFASLALTGRPLDPVSVLSGERSFEEVRDAMLATSISLLQR